MKNSGVWFAFGTLLVMPVLLVLALSWYAHYQFGRDCGGWLKLAADANSISTAAERLDKAIDYLDRNRMTEGTTALIFPSPTRDIGVWYTNLKQTSSNLHNFPANPTEADTNTMLVKLRETLLDHGEHGDAVTIPAGLAYYPHIWAWRIAWVVSIGLGLVGLCMCCVVLESIK